MNDRGRKHLRRSERVRDLATSLKSAFPEGSKGAASIAKITQLIEHIKTLDTSSVTNAREIANVSGAKGDARKELRDILRTISRTARTVDRKSTRLNSSHDQISYAVFCLKKKKQNAGSCPKRSTEYERTPGTRLAEAFERS